MIKTLLFNVGVSTSYERLDILMAVAIKISLTGCDAVQFGGTCCLLLQGRSESHMRKG
jgi:hypothetical protein